MASTFSSIPLDLSHLRPHRNVVLLRALSIAIEGSNARLKIYLLILYLEPIEPCRIDPHVHFAISDFVSAREHDSSHEGNTEALKLEIGLHVKILHPPHATHELGHPAAPLTLRHFK